MTADQAKAPTRAFGEESRRQLLDSYFSRYPAIGAEEAWKHVYRLLLWIDRTTGLAHCYESDKSQPGRPWYGRSLAFHGWLASEFKAEPATLGDQLDWLFLKTSERLAVALVAEHKKRTTKAEAQRARYGVFPVPGEDPGLERILLDELGAWFAKPPPRDALKRVTERVRVYYSQENKRKNLLGEGFEDVLDYLIARTPKGGKLKTLARPVLHDIPGFRRPPKGEKPRTVDLAVVGSPERRVLATVKWSIRADREEQFGVDFEAYARLEEAGKDFEYFLITNEFDAARLDAACERRRPNANLFSAVVHVNPQGPIAAYGESGRGAAKKLSAHIKSGRLISLGAWLKGLSRK